MENDEWEMFNLSPLFDLPESSELNINLEEEDSIADSDSKIETPSYSPLSISTPSSPESHTQSILDSDQDELIVPPTLSIMKIPTFKIIGDNVDKGIKPRHETIDCHSRSLHYFHSCAVMDRVDMSAFDDNNGLPHIGEINIKELLPNEDDHASLVSTTTVLMMRVVQKYLPFFKKNLTQVQKHIKHCYSVEMAKKSTVVSN